MNYLLTKIRKTLFATLYLILIVCGFYACASIGNPEGGAYDIEPPVFIKSNPLPNTIQFEGNKIEILFDEYISIEKPNEKVIITPPQIKTPTIRAVGKKITVELRDSLIPNTTYTFDFTDGIVDNNEKNSLDGFTFAFSTGEVVDSLMVSGLLLNAENLEPMPNVLVGLHNNLADSAFTTQAFTRTSRTNDRGQFWIRNVSPGEYKVYALNDQNRNYYFDQPTEGIAFLDSIIVPSFLPAICRDTIWQDSLTIDTILDIGYNRFIPDGLTLFLFNETFDPQYFIRSERIDEKQFRLSFNSQRGLPPALEILNENLPKQDKDWYVLEYDPKENNLLYWIKDSLVYQADTLHIKLDYLADDSLNRFVMHTDTLKIPHKKKEKAKDKKKKGEPDKEFLEVNITPSGTIDITDTIRFEFSEPVTRFSKEQFLFQQKIDSLWEDRSADIIQDSLNPRVFYLDYKFPYGKEFQLSLDSAAVHGIYGLTNDSLRTTFKLREEEEYGHLYIIVQGLDSDSAIGQLLNASDAIVRESLLIDGELVFENLKPGKYYLRCIDDINGNGKWDTGNYYNKQQPETVYYFNSFFDIRQYSEIEQNWNVKEVPVEKQKPLDVMKNKPVQKKQEKQNEKANENKKNTNSSTTPSSIKGGKSSGFRKADSGNVRAR